MGKQTNQFKIISTLFRLEVVKGHLKWTVADLARKSGVSRPTIYEYFGSNKKMMLETALHSLCMEYYGLTPARKELAAKDFMASALLTRKLFEETPEFLIFYHYWHSRGSTYKDIIQNYENQYKEKVRALSPHLPEEKVTLFHTILHGLITAPFLDEAGFRSTLKEALKLLA